MNAKIDEINKTLNEINITLAKQQVSLDEHIRRTNLLEEYVKEDKEQFVVITRHIAQVRIVASIFVIALGFALTYKGLK